MKKLLSIAAATAFMSTSALAGNPVLDGGMVSMNADGELKNAVMTVTGPNGYYKSSDRSNSTTSVSLASDNGLMADGTYTWQLTGNSGKRIVTYKNTVDNGRGDAQRGYTFETVTRSGSFTILNGVHVDSTLVEK